MPQTHVHESSEQHFSTKDSHDTDQILVAAVVRQDGLFREHQPGKGLAPLIGGEVSDI